MNNLNSLIVEGVVIGEPHYLEEKGILSFSFETTSYYKTRDGNDATELSQFNIVAYGCMPSALLKDGVGVRVVGRLKQNTWVDGGVTHSEVQVVAEHIEVKITK